jgi:hypothetical protein
LLAPPSYSQKTDTSIQATGEKKLTADSFSDVNNDKVTVSSSDQPGNDSNNISEYNPLSSLTFYLSIFVLVFGLIIMGLETYLIATKRINTDYAIKFITVTLIVTSTLFLITAGYSNNQIAPAMGLLGTIAGYLLGKTNNNPPGKNE